MYITTVGKGKNAKVYLMEDYKEAGKRKKRVLKFFGTLDDLLAKDPNALEKLKAEYASPRSKKAKDAENPLLALFQNATRQFLANNSSYVFYSNYILLQVWEELGLSAKIQELQNKYAPDLKFDLNNVAFTMTFLKAIKPTTLKKTYRQKAHLLGAPFEQVNISDICVTLDFLYQHKDEIFQTINEKVDQMTERSYSLIFYNPMDEYVSCDLNEIEDSFLKDYDKTDLLKLLNMAVADNVITQEEADKFVELNFEMAILPYILKYDLRYFVHLKIEEAENYMDDGESTHSVVFLVDDNGTPVEYKIFSGYNANYKTILNYIDQVKENYKIKDLKVLVNNDLDKFSNLEWFLDHGLGFITIKDLVKIDDKYEKEILDKSGYLKYEFSKDLSQSNISTDVLRNIGFNPIDYSKTLDILKYKTIDYEKTYPDKDPIPCKLILVQGKEPEESQVSMDLFYRDILHRLDKSTSDKCQRLASFKGILYHNSSDNLDLDDAETKHAIDSCPKLIQADHYFRDMEYHLEIGDFRVKSEDHLEGQTMCAVLALILLKVLEIKLDKYGMPMNILAIISALQEAKLTILSNFADRDLFIKAKEPDKVSKKTTKQSEKSKSVANIYDRIDILMQCVGFEPLKDLLTNESLAESLKIQLAENQKLLDPLIYEMEDDDLDEDLF